MSGTIIRQYGGRSVWVHVPPGYDSARRAPYPLLVMHDGQNLTAARPGAFGGSWRADETLDALFEGGRIPPLVLAGVDHAGQGRIDEFAVPRRRPWRSRAPRRYARLLEQDVIPGLAADFHVDVSPSGLGLGGSSMGGLATLWLAALDSGRFGRLLVLSPSVWWRRRAILRLLRRHPLDPAARVWIQAGRHEGAQTVDDARAVADLLREQGVGAVRFVEDTQGHHDEASWARQFEDALTWLYRDAARLDHPRERNDRVDGPPAAGDHGWYARVP